MTETKRDELGDVLERLAEELRGVRSSFECSNMEGEVAYYAALNSVATCIENVAREFRIKASSAK